VDQPCCDCRDHGSLGCACPEHMQSELHPFGWNADDEPALFYGPDEPIEDDEEAPEINPDALLEEYHWQLCTKGF
jgi:hypothetical protein